MIDRFREFIVLADTLNFRTAAARLFVTQPTLSRHIAKLEEELGAPLFARTTTSVALTAFGASILPEARDIVDRFDRLMEKSPAYSPRGVLRIGGFIRQPAVAALLKRSIDAFRDAYPHIDLSVADANVADPAQLLAEGRFDVVLSPRLDFSDQSAVVYRDLMTLPVNAWVAAASPLTQAKAVSLADLAPLGFVTSSSGGYEQTYAHFLGLFAARGLTPRIGRRFTSDYDDELACDEYTMTIDFPPELHRGIHGAVALPLAEGETVTISAACLAENDRHAAGLFARTAERVARGDGRP